MTEAPMKFVPVTVSVNAGLPAATVLGEMELSVGAGLLMVNVWATEVPPPGAGLKTVTCAVPAVATSAAVTCAVNCVLLVYVVGRALPFHWTTEALMKFVPFTVSVSVPLPATTLVGARELTVGTGFGALIVNVWALEVPPPGVGLKTVTCALPAVAISA